MRWWRYYRLLNQYARVIIISLTVFLLFLYFAVPWLRITGILTKGVLNPTYEEVTYTLTGKELAQELGSLYSWIGQEAALTIYPILLLLIIIGAIYVEWLALLSSLGATYILYDTYVTLKEIGDAITILDNPQIEYGPGFIISIITLSIITIIIIILELVNRHW